MAEENKEFKIHLICSKLSNNTEEWFWMSPKSGKKISPQFSTKPEAEEWFSRTTTAMSECAMLIARAKQGKFYNLSARIDTEIILPKDKTAFAFRQTGDIIWATVLGVDIQDARNRVNSVIPIREWVE